MNIPKRRQAFSLIEVLVALSITGILLGSLVLAVTAIHGFAGRQERRLVARLLVEGLLAEASVRGGRPLATIPRTRVGSLRWVHRVLGVPARADGNSFTVERAVAMDPRSLRLTTVTVRYPDGPKTVTLSGSVRVGPGPLEEPVLHAQN